MSDSKKRTIRRVPAGMVAFLVLWYSVLSACGVYLVYTYYLKVQPPTIDLANVAFICGSVALMTSSIFYIRKTYKDVFDVNIENTKENTKEEGMALLAYYVTRPIFAIFFSFLSVIATYAFTHAAVVGVFKFGEGFLHLNLLVSAYGGVATGQVISRVEKVGAVRVNAAHI